MRILECPPNSTRHVCECDTTDRQTERESSPRLLSLVNRSAHHGIAWHSTVHHTQPFHHSRYTTAATPQLLHHIQPLHHSRFTTAVTTHLALKKAMHSSSSIKPLPSTSTRNMHFSIMLWLAVIPIDCNSSWNSCLSIMPNGYGKTGERVIY